MRQILTIRPLGPQIIRILVLSAMWMLMWSDLSLANFLAGVGLAIAIAAFGEPGPRQLIFRPLPALRFAGHFGWALFQSTASVTRTVIAPQHRLSTGIIGVPLTDCPDALITIVANCVSLTPGTLSVEVTRDPTVLYVHALDARPIEEIRADVRRFELLTINAFGDEAARRGLTVDDSVIIGSDADRRTSATGNDSATKNDSAGEENRAGETDPEAD